jgi:hypothetical protein
MRGRGSASFVWIKGSIVGVEAVADLGVFLDNVGNLSAHWKDD